MAGRIHDEDIQALRERADLAAIVSDYTGLKRAGGKLKGLCPFHAEKTPSFTVDPMLHLFHCFGCGVGGDAYEFLMRIEALTFPEAVERLARLVGFDLRYVELSAGARKSLGRRTRLALALVHAAEWYAEQLHEAEAAPARSYLAQRGVGTAQVEQFALGWAPDRWDGVVRHLQASGFEPREIEDAGLATRGRHGLVDRFRGRVMFPIYDKSGKDVVGFGGRVVPGVALRTASGDVAPAKYINSPETEVYRKSRTLYALNWARAEVQRQGEVLVVEGYMDVIALHRVGVRNTVATCGTSLTPDHFRQLEQFTVKVVLALDADDAGFAAAERARELAEEAGVREVAVLPLPQGQDPADLAEGGEEAVQVALKGTKTALEFQIEHLLRGASISTPEGQIDAYRRTFPLLARLEDRFLRYTYIRDIVAPVVRLSADLIERELDESLPQVRRQPAPATFTAPVPKPGDVAGSAPRDPQLLLEREVLLAALRHPHLLPRGWEQVTPEDFRSPMSRQLFTAIVAGGNGNLEEILAVLPDDDMRARVRALALSEETIPADPGHVAELVARLRAAAVKRQAEEVRERLERLNEHTDSEERRTLVARLWQLETHRRRLLEVAQAGGGDDGDDST